MVKKQSLVLFTGILILSSCASNNKKVDPNYLAYLNAMQNTPKIVEIEAQPGQTIELKGVKKFVVYAPSSSRNITQYRKSPDAAVQITHDLLHTTASLLPGYWGWKYGSQVLKTALKEAGDKYNIGGDYMTGGSIKTGGDYVGAGGKWTISGDYVGNDKWDIGQDNISGDKWDIGGDNVGGNKAGNDNIGQDYNDNDQTNTNSENTYPPSNNGTTP